MEAFLSAGYSPLHVLGIITAIAAKVFSNYTNHLAATGVDEMFAIYSIEAKAAEAA